MAYPSEPIDEVVARLERGRLGCDYVSVYNQLHTDETFAPLAQSLLTHPNRPRYLYLSNNRLTDKTGIQLADFTASSSTIKWLGLPINQLGLETYLALATALRVNSSLRLLYLFNNRKVEQATVETAFVDALRLNPVRPAESDWRLFSTQNEFSRLRDTADFFGPPSLLAQLDFVEDCRAETKIHTL